MRSAVFAVSHKYNSNIKVGDHHYAKYFAQKGYRVLWLSAPNSPLFYLQNRKKYFDRKINNNAPPEKVDNNIFEYIPRTFLPYGTNNFFFSSIWAARNSLRFCLPDLRIYLSKINFLV